MASSAIKSGALVNLSDLQPSSPFFKQGASLKVIGKLQEYTVETASAVITDGNAILKIDTQHLRDLSFRIGSIYSSLAILQARVGRNVDGQSLQILRQFQANHVKNSTP